ncbi:MAG: hypothetical protein QF835_07190 [Candidatus Marinimicrobia bacterium]|nr:hypothetical protein [Candidatus Neomarinimicrobiota bacterium]MDP6401615.1 hypothetical protein [Candidatus Neomarinimicrobiota bacterium]MDP6614792.1 hypothetical protein [Candidatus Neomarinimicrobiota bacterium]HJM94721.1 hypothetical protein [Candidatus Neomarinimicrobiota bacterium]|tara:strand:- start:8207 stop:10444 length:2238 start_codon:yes stop_codon:yes gene_type:complete
MSKIIIYLVMLTAILWSQSGVLIMSPNPGEEISSNDILIAVSFYRMNGVNPGDIKLTLDGQDITSQAFIDSDIISCLVDNLDPGEHQATLVLGGPVRPETWSFSVAMKEPALEYSGRIRSGSSVDQIGDQSLNISQVMLNMKGTAYEWLKFRTNVKLTTQENLLYQPRNVYGFSFALQDFATLNLGDSNPRISYFTMNGKRIRGLDANLKLGWFNAHFVQGEINRAVQGASEKAYEYTIDTDDEGTKYLSLGRSGYTFKQNVLSGRLALGRGEKFQWGLNFMKARDDTTSVTQVLDDATIVYSPDATGYVAGLDSGTVYTIRDLGSIVQFQDGANWSGAGPKDNIVLGTDLGIYLDNKRILLEGELAFSLTNNNIWGGPLTLAAMDTLIDDSLDNKISSFDLSGLPDPADYTHILIINSNLTPLIPIDINAFGDSSTVSIDDAVLSMPSLAYRGRAVVNYFGNYLAMEYSQVGPEFNSLANPYLVTNKREFSFSDKLKLLQNRLMITAGYKHQDDDILTTVENVESQNTLSLGVNALPGPGLPTVNFTYRSIDRDNGIDEIVQLTDTTFSDNRENTHTDNLMLNVSHRFELLWSHSMNGTFVMVGKKDQFADRDETFVDPGISTRVFNITLSTRYRVPLKTTINMNTNSSELSIGPGERGKQDFLTGSLDAEYSFLDNKISARGGLNFAQGTGLVDMSWLGFKGGLRWKITRGLNLNGQGEFRAKKIDGEIKNSLTARANLEYAF